MNHLKRDKKTVGLRFDTTTLSQLKTFALEFLHSRPQGGTIGLVGDLGVRKTTFVQTCANILAETHQQQADLISSPSFVIHQSYPQLIPPIEHFDFYRLDSLGSLELLELGYFDSVQRALAGQGFVFVEWPNRAQQLQLLELDAELIFEFHGSYRSVTYGIWKLSSIGWLTAAGWAIKKLALLGVQ